MNFNDHFFYYLDAQVSYILPRIQSKKNQEHFLEGIQTAKFATITQRGHSIRKLKTNRKSKWWQLSNKPRYYNLGLMVADDLHQSLIKRGF